MNNSTTLAIIGAVAILGIAFYVSSVNSRAAAAAAKRTPLESLGGLVGSAVDWIT